MLAVDLRIYGEDNLADRVASMAREELQPVYDRAHDYLMSDEYATASGASPPISCCLAMAAVEHLEGYARPLRWKRRGWSTHQPPPSGPSPACGSSFGSLRQLGGAVAP
jgi:hypothetical protein